MLRDAGTHTAARKLLAFFQTANQAIGDAISILILTEAILIELGWSVAQWAELYTDLPSRQEKLSIPDRSAVKVTADETRVTDPPELQVAIDRIVGASPGARAFVRPSGTEDAVRIYAEASTQEDADEVARQVRMTLVSMFCEQP